MQNPKKQRGESNIVVPRKVSMKNIDQLKKMTANNITHSSFISRVNFDSSTKLKPLLIPNFQKQSSKTKFEGLRNLTKKEVSKITQNSSIFASSINNALPSVVKDKGIISRARKNSNKYKEDLGHPNKDSQLKYNLYKNKLEDKAKDDNFSSLYRSYQQLSLIDAKRSGCYTQRDPKVQKIISHHNTKSGNCSPKLKKAHYESPAIAIIKNGNEQIDTCDQIINRVPSGDIAIMDDVTTRNRSNKISSQRISGKFGNTMKNLRIEQIVNDIRYNAKKNVSLAAHHESNNKHSLNRTQSKVKSNLKKIKEQTINRVNLNTKLRADLNCSGKKKLKNLICKGSTTKQYNDKNDKVHIDMLQSHFESQTHQVYRKRSITNKKNNVSSKLSGFDSSSIFDIVALSKNEKLRKKSCSNIKKSDRQVKLAINHHDTLIEDTIKKDDNFSLIDMLVPIQQKEVNMTKLHTYLNELYKDIMFTKILLKNIDTDDVINNFDKVTIDKQNREQSKIKTIILDLDETLVHAEPVKADVVYDHTFELSRGTIGVWVRPFLTEFLNQMSKKFELILYTASGEIYANNIKKIIDPNNIYFTELLHRKNCVYYKAAHIKCIDVISNRDKSDILIIDNALYAFPFDHSSKVLIKPFYNDKKDCELLKFISFIRRNILNTNSDILSLLKESVSCKHLLDCSDMQDLVHLFKKYIT